MQYTIQRKTLIRVHVKINPKASVLNMNCCRVSDRKLTESIL